MRTVTCFPIMIYIKSLDRIDEEAQRRVDFDINDKTRRKDLIQLRKEIMNEMTVAFFNEKK